jgi:hypothetical protein
MKAGSLILPLLVGLACAAGIWLGTPWLAAAPTSAPADAPSDRLTFLTLQLSSVEESIKAIDKALRVTGYQASVAADKAEDYQKGNEIMDRKGGAPVPWDEFYGRTARSFYVPRSVGSLEASGNGRQVDAHVATGYHPIARPTQFDYLYRANNQQAAKAMQEVAAMEQKSSVLLARRRQLEAEQSALWANIAFESIGNREISYQPLYRFALRSDHSATTQPASDSQRDLVEASILFLRLADRCASYADDAVSDHQEMALPDLRHNIEAGHATLKESAFNDLQAMQVSPDDLQQVKDLLAIAKQISELARNISDSYHLAADGDAAGDEARKQTFRAQLQDSLLGFADATGALDDAIENLATHWVIRPQTGVPAPALASPQVSSNPVTPPVTPAAAAPVIPAAPAVAAGGTAIPTNQASTAPHSIFDDTPADPGAVSGIPSKHVFTATDKITGNLSFVSGSGPYQIQDKLGPTPGLKNYTIEIGPGAEVDGGTIDFGRYGQVKITGTPDAPAVIRGVTFDQGLWGLFQAKYADFEDCRFRKVGAYFDRGGYSSRWQMDKCFIRGEKSFANLTHVDYGIKFTDCTFSNVTLTNLGSADTPKDKPWDCMKSFRTGWRIIDHCQLNQCTIAPSVFWCAMNSNYDGCKFPAGAAFQSDTPTTVVAFVTNSNGDAPDKVNAANPPKRGTLTIAYATQPFDVFHFPNPR